MMIDSLSISVVKTDMCYNFQQIQLTCNCEDCQTTVDYYLNARNKYLRKIREGHISRILKSFFFSDICSQDETTTQIWHFMFPQFDRKRSNRGINCSLEIANLKYLFYLVSLFILNFNAIFCNWDTVITLKADFITIKCFVVFLI